MTMPLQLFLVIVCLALGTPSVAGENWRDRPSEVVLLTPSDIYAEYFFGKNIAARLLANNPALDNAALSRYINLVGQTLVSNTNRPEIDFHFAILDTDSVCSYAAPGGYVFISMGALKTMEDEAELAGLLAHEIAHVLSRQVVTRFKIIGSDDTTNLAHLISGNAAALLSAVEARKGVTIGSPLFADAVASGYEFIHIGGYDENAEQQADMAALHISLLSGYDPGGLARYFKRNQNLADNPSSQCSSNNYLPERLDKINSFLQQSVLKIPLQKNATRFNDSTKFLP